MNTTLSPEAKRLRDMLADIIRQPFAWPGGYEKIAVTTDGGLLCSKCCKAEASRIMSDIRDFSDSGWLISSVQIEAVSPNTTKEMAGEDCISTCDHCGKEIGEMS